MRLDAINCVILFLFVLFHACRSFAFAQLVRPAPVVSPSIGSDTVDDAQFFGYAVATSSSNIVIGAKLASIGAVRSGAVYVYTYSTNGFHITWEEVQELTSSDSSADDQFGVSLDISNDMIAVGSHHDDDSAQNHGAVYMFQEVTPNVWVEIQKLVAWDVHSDSKFGSCVSLDAFNVVSCAPYENSDVGGCYLFYYDMGSWVQGTKMLHVDANANWFGFAVDAESALGFVAVGSPVTSTGIGSVEMYGEDSTGIWTWRMSLVPTDQTYSHEFGASVSIWHDTVAVGAPESDSGPHSYTYIFIETSPGMWMESAKLQASDASASAGFGWSLSLMADTLLVGAPFKATAAGSFSGGFYVFQLVDNSWMEKDMMDASIAYESLGFSVSISENLIVAGAYSDSPGRAYLTRFDPKDHCIATNICEHNGTCVDHAFIHECICIGGYGGINCTECVCQNGGSCAPSMCDCHGTHFIGDLCDTSCYHGFADETSQACNCTGSGATGEFCQEDIDDCQSNPCLHGGTCVDYGDSLFPDHSNEFACLCNETGYHGLRCDISDCMSNPCLHNGTCNVNDDTLLSGISCNCSMTPYEGTWCDIETDECLSNPCQNNATCKDELGNYSCECTTGWSNRDCDVDVDDCVSSPCSPNSTCKDKGTNNFRCVCDNGYAGTLCYEDADDCASNPCLNGGTCEDVGTNLFQCTCPWLWNGDICSEDYDPCQSSPCFNNGLCTRTEVVHDVGYTCKCDESRAYTGIACNVSCNNGLGAPRDANDTLANHGCSCFGTGHIGSFCDVNCNGGSSAQLNMYGEPTCNCTGLNYTGSTCTTPCENGGYGDFNMNTFSSESCVCQSGFTGSFCADDIDDCSSSPCSSHGACVDIGQDLYRCDCDLGYHGDLCDDIIDYCNPREAPSGQVACIDDPGITCGMCVTQQQNNNHVPMISTSNVTLSQSNESNHAIDNWIPNCYTCYGQYSLERQCIPTSACYVEFLVTDTEGGVRAKEQVCTSGYRSNTGATCDMCDNGFFREESGACITCPATGFMTWVILALIIVGIMMVIAVVVNFGAQTVKFASISFDFVQMVVISLSVNINWPTPVQDMRDTLSVVMFSFDGFGGPSCMFNQLDDIGSYIVGFLIVEIIPILFLCYLVLSYYIRTRCCRCCQSADISPTVHHELVNAACWRQWCTFFMVTYLPVVQKSWAHFNCITQTDGAYVLASNAAISCDSKEWHSLAPAAIIMIILVGFGIPLLSAYIFCIRPHYLITEETVNIVDIIRYLLKRINFPVQEYDITQRLQYELAMLRWTDRFSPLCLMFEANAYFWSLIQLFRAFCMANLSGVLNITEPQTHAILLLVINASFLYAHFRISPYVSNTLDKLESSTGSATLFMLCAGLFGSWFGSTVASVLGYIVIVLVSVVLAMALSLTLKAAVARKERGRVTDENRRMLAMQTFYPVIALQHCELSLNRLKSDTFVYEQANTIRDRATHITKYLVSAASSTSEKFFRKSDEKSAIIDDKTELCNVGTSADMKIFLSQQQCAGQKGSVASFESANGRLLIQPCLHVEALYNELTGDENLAGTDVRDHGLVTAYLTSHYNNDWVTFNVVDYLSILLQLHALGKHIRAYSKNELIQIWSVIFTYVFGIVLLILAQDGFHDIDVAIASGIGFLMATICLKSLLVMHVFQNELAIQKFNQMLDGSNALYASTDDDNDIDMKGGYIWTEAPVCTRCTRRDGVYTVIGTRDAKAFMSVKSPTMASESDGSVLDEQEDSHIAIIPGQDDDALDNKALSIPMKIEQRASLSAMSHLQEVTTAPCAPTSELQFVRDVIEPGKDDQQHEVITLKDAGILPGIVDRV